MKNKYYTSRIYSKSEKREHELIYFANYGRFYPEDYHVYFSQFDPSFFNLYISINGKCVPMLKMEMDCDSKISQKLIHNPQIFSDFFAFKSLMKDQKGLLFEDFEKNKVVLDGKERKSEPILVNFEKALEFL